MAVHESHHTHMWIIGVIAVAAMAMGWGIGWGLAAGLAGCIAMLAVVFWFARSVPTTSSAIPVDRAEQPTGRT